MNYQEQLLEDYILRFLILSYIIRQRNWVLRFSIKKVFGKYYIQLSVVSGSTKTKSIPFIYKPFISTLLNKSLKLRPGQIKDLQLNYNL